MNRLNLFALLSLFTVFNACRKGDSPPPDPVTPTPPPVVVHVSSLTTTDSLSMILPLDSTFQLSISVIPSNSSNPKLNYSSSDSSILKVTSTGLLTAAAVGLTTVRITSVDSPGLIISIQVAVVKNYTVYIAGYGPQGYDHQAMVWVDGTPTVLTPGGYEGGCNASSLAISGSDLYVGGEVLDTTGFTLGAYWKNGVVTEMNYPGSTLGSYITAIAVSGATTLLAGYVTREISFPSWDPTYLNDPIWNGAYYSIVGNTATRTLLETDTNNLLSLAYSMALSGSDVYTAGAFEAGKGNRIATYWKNNMVGAVPLAGGGDWSEAEGIAVQGGNVYVTGYEQCPNYGCIPTVKLWTNDMNTVVNLTNGMVTALPTCLAVTDTAQFVGGYQLTAAGIKQAMLWRVKGNAVVPIPISNGLTDAVINGIAVSGNDIFLAGYQFDPSWNARVATYWRVFGSIVSAPVRMPIGWDNNGAKTNSEANAILIQ